MVKRKQSTLGYIGLGNIGGPMAVRLAMAGFSLHVYGRNNERLKPAIAAGAVECASASEVAERSDLVFTCLTNTAAVEKVVFDPAGIAEGAKPGAILIDMSTISPDATVAMATRLRDTTGMEWMDAPVSGGTVGATDGTLSIFMGGRAKCFEIVRPVLMHVGRNVTLTGPLGTGQTTKLINQVVVCCSIVMLARHAPWQNGPGLTSCRCRPLWRVDLPTPQRCEPIGSGLLSVIILLTAPLPASLRTLTWSRRFLEELERSCPSRQRP